VTGVDVVVDVVEQLERVPVPVAFFVPVFEQNAGLVGRLALRHPLLGRGETELEEKVVDHRRRRLADPMVGTLLDSTSVTFTPTSTLERYAAVIHPAEPPPTIAIDATLFMRRRFSYTTSLVFARRLWQRESDK